MIRPPLTSAAHARDFVACAKVYLIAPGFRSPRFMWRSSTFEALANVIDDLEAEAKRLGEPPQPTV